MDGARSILLSITGGRDLSLWEVNEAAKAVAEAAHPEANIIFGAMVDEKLDDAVWVTVVATGYGQLSRRPAREEPRGEPRVSRGPARQRPRASAPARSEEESSRSARERYPAAYSAPLGVDSLWANRDIPHANAPGRARLSNSTAYGAATKAMASRPSFRRRPTPRSRAGSLRIRNLRISSSASRSTFRSIVHQAPG